jgi:hypothetical protein
MGSPFTLNEVLSSTGTPVSALPDMAVVDSAPAKKV